MEALKKNETPAQEEKGVGVVGGKGMGRILWGAAGPQITSDEWELWKRKGRGEGRAETEHQ